MLRKQKRKEMKEVEARNNNVREDEGRKTSGGSTVGYELRGNTT